MNNKNKVAILGGSFDPPTAGHLEIARYLLDYLMFDQVWIMPAYVHTFEKPLTDFSHRINMCNLLFDDNRFIISDFQKTSNCDSSTLNLFKLLQREFVDNEFYMVIGSDNANVIHKWIDHEELIKSVKFIVIERTGQELDQYINWCLSPPHIFIKSFSSDISSTKIRICIKNGKSIEGYTGLKVIKYIEDNNLYK